MLVSSRPASLQARLVAVASRAPGLTITLIVLAVTALFLALLPRPLSPDVSGQLWIADRLGRGARLYIDISEINPPLWFWLAVPVDMAAAVAQVRVEDGLIAAVGGAALLSLLAVARLVREWLPVTRTMFLAYAAAILLVMPLRDLGQREQLALIGALPYVVLVARRREGKFVSWWLALSVGGAAAVAFALKHYFVGVPVSLELWLLASRRRAWRPIRPETTVLAVAALVYVAAILIVTPAYLRVSVPELELAYGAAGATDLRHMIRPAQPVWVLTICAIVAHRRVTGRPVTALPIALLIAALGFFAAWLVQHKGWPYQSIATTGLLALALVAFVLDGAPGSPHRPRAIVVAALVSAVLLCAVPTQWVPGPGADIAPALADLEPGDTVAIVSKEGRTAWPSTVDRGFRFVGRRGAFWMFGAIDADAARPGDGRVATFGRRVVREAARDYRCTPPERIIFTPRGEPGDGRASANPLAFFRRDPGFVRLLDHYRPLPVRGDYAAFALATPLVAGPTDRCGAQGEPRLP